jgi:hypothetical protein
MPCLAPKHGVASLSEKLFLTFRFGSANSTLCGNKKGDQLLIRASNQKCTSLVLKTNSVLDRNVFQKPKPGARLPGFETKAGLIRVSPNLFAGSGQLHLAICILSPF